MERDETWVSDEYGTSHKGRVGVLLADGTGPGPVYFDSSSSGSGWEVRHWSVYDGEGPDTPRPKAAALRAECSCGWTGGPRPVDWEKAGELSFGERAGADADRCATDWDRHTTAVDESTVALPAELEELLEEVMAAIEYLGQVSPTAGLKAARRLEVIAQRTAHWPAHDARAHDVEKVAAALGLSIDATRSLLARYGGWSPYS